MTLDAVQSTLRGTVDYGMNYERRDGIELIGYTNSD